MSYLDVPRIHFAGKFRATPSTVNNDESNYSLPAVVVNKGGLGWNPNGNNYWQFVGCKVQSAVGADGAKASDLRGAKLGSTDQPVPAKLVDLDPEQQMVSTVWGLTLRLSTAGGDFVEGSFRAVPFNDIWKKASEGVAMTPLGAYYQSVLENLKWSRTLKSPTLKKLRSVSPDALSVKFTVDSYQWQQSRPDFGIGRLVGTLGPAAAGEPPNFVPARLLRPASQNSPLNFAPARVDEARGRVLVDLGNSLPTTGPFGPFANLGNLQLAILAKGDEPQHLLGPVGNVPFETNAGVYEVPVSARQLALLDKTPLGVVQVGAGGDTQLWLAENSIGAYLDATNYVFRLNPGDPPARVTLVASTFGRPAKNQKINLQAQTFDGQAVAGDQPPLQFPANVKTNASGRATVTLKPGDPGTPRPVDGQVYAVTFSWDSPPADYNPDANRFLSLHVYSGFKVVASPKWADIGAIFEQYAKLYPFMRNIIDLSDPAEVKKFADRIAAAINLPETHPHHMPVTRDLSKNKRRTILNWLAKGAPV